MNTTRLLNKLLAMALCFSLVSAPMAFAQSKRQAPSLPLIRDAEIEGLLRIYTLPIFKAAGLNPRAVKVYLINKQSINAFVAGGQRIFIHTGLLLKAKTPNEVIGVLAHETGHIAGGHLVRMGVEMEKASYISIISMLLGAGAMIGGAMSRNSDAASVGQATILGGQHIAQRFALKYIRTQEAAADQAAMRYLSITKQSGRGMLELFHTLAGQSLGSLSRVDPYTLTHPMPFERIRNLERQVKKSKFRNRKDSAGLLFRHKLMQAKLVGYSFSRRQVLNRFPWSNTSIPAKYARAIVLFRTGDLHNALPIINDLISDIPQNPYFWELQGQALLESGRPKEAVRSLKIAAKKTGNNGLISIMLARSYLEIGGKANAKAALKVLKKARRAEKENPSLHYSMARAYAILRNFGRAELATAEAAMLVGDKELASEKSESAYKLLRRGSPGWQRARDIVNFSTRK